MQRGAIATSVARSCRVSYSKHDGSTATPEEDVQLFAASPPSSSIHASPLEHQATPVAGVPKGELARYQGNFKGFSSSANLCLGRRFPCRDHLGIGAGLPAQGAFGGRDEGQPFRPTRSMASASAIHRVYQSKHSEQGPKPFFRSCFARLIKLI